MIMIVFCKENKGILQPTSYIILVKLILLETWAYWRLVPYSIISQIDDFWARV
jgi:hypothetical protein